MSLYRPLEHDGELLCLKLVRKDHAIPLSDVLPVLEKMGLRVLQEQPYEIVTARFGRFWLHDFRVQPIEAIPSRHRAGRRRLPGSLHPGLARRGRERRLQPAGAARARMAADRGPARVLQVPASGGHPVQPSLHGADPGAQSGPRAPGRGAVRGAASIPPPTATARPRSPTSKHSSGGTSMGCPTSTRIASSGATCA